MPLIVPGELVERVAVSSGAYFEPVSGISRDGAARDLLDGSKAARRASILARYGSLEGARLLEIGSGFGVNLATWIAETGVDGYGVEPGGEGFGSTVAVSRDLLSANGIDPERIILGRGEALPLPDASFTIVYSANVLEHTDDPERVLGEALRVLRPGGLLHMEVPNYLAWFEGHYMLPMPPAVHPAELRAWVRLLGRDPAYARTLHTEINPRWCRAALRRLRSRYPHRLLSLGDDLFLDRLAAPFEFETRGAEDRLAPAISALQRINLSNWVGHLMVALQAWYPLYITARRI